MDAMKQPVSTPKSNLDSKLMKSGLPGTPAEQRRDLRAAIKRHAETLRRLGR
jgi:hypothetical protein